MNLGKDGSKKKRVRRTKKDEHTTLPRVTLPKIEAVSPSTTIDNMQHIVEENESIIKDMLGESPTLFDEVWTFPVNPIKDADIMSIDEQGTINTNTTYQAYPVDFYDQLLPTEDIKTNGGMMR